MIKLKKTCTFFISLSMMFAIVTPNFANAMKWATVVPSIVLYDANSKRLMENQGRIIDENDEDIDWQLGAEALSATLKINDNVIDEGAIPIDSFNLNYEYNFFNGVYKKGKIIVSTPSLERWLRENAKGALKIYSCKEIQLEINTKLITNINGEWKSLPCRLAMIVIR
ncbi:MAG: hypothetical protein RUMPE_00273 [Eubacteriales bacterium SKADARSKE-1]|nr:hypothetical protein [Eubacteriales bacterium SKADARSKE-1]